MGTEGAMGGGGQVCSGTSRHWLEQEEGEGVTRREGQDGRELLVMLAE
jgi:hypothetical protein